MKSHKNATNQPLPYHRKRLIAFNYRFFGFISQGLFYDHFHTTADNTDNDRAYDTDVGQDQKLFVIVRTFFFNLSVSQTAP